MRVLLDEIECNTNAASVAQAVAVGATLAEQQGRLIVEIVVDGESWTEERLNRDSTTQVADEVRLTSADPKELVCQTFEEAAEALLDADRLQQSAAELMQADQIAQGMNQLNEAFSIWLSVQQAVVMGTQVAGIDFEQSLANSPAAAGQSINAIIEHLNQQLRAVRDALENRDTIALADLLLYDLPDVVLQWRALLQDLQRDVRGEGG